MASTPSGPEKVQEPMDAQNSSHHGGLKDEDDKEEWEAIKQSPVKEWGVHISDHVHCHHVHLSTPRWQTFINAGYYKGWVTGESQATR